MTVYEIIDSVYAFDGDAKDWLAYEKRIKKETKKLNDYDSRILSESEAMEHLLMICEGIRFEQLKKESE